MYILAHCFVMYIFVISHDGLCPLFQERVCSCPNLIIIQQNDKSLVAYVYI